MTISSAVSDGSNDAELAQLLVKEALEPISTGYRDLVAAIRADPELAQYARADLTFDRLLTSDFLASYRKSKGELVSAGEKRAGALIRSLLSQARPSDNYRGEETGSVSGETGVWWLDDPVDGTAAMIKTAFMEAFNLEPPDPRPTFGITVGKVEQGLATLGVVAELRPSSDGQGLEVANLWVGQKTPTGFVTTCNGTQVAKVSPVVTACTAVVTTAPDVMFLDAGGKRDYIKEAGFESLLAATGQSAPVIDGNIIGILDTTTRVAYERDLTSEDIAAAGPILQGVGLVLVDSEGNSLQFDDLTREYTIVAGNTHAVEHAVAAIQSGEREAMRLAQKPKNMRPPHPFFDTLYAGDVATGHTQKFAHELRGANIG